MGFTVYFAMSAFLLIIGCGESTGAVIGAGEHYNLGVGHEEQNRHEEAISEYDKAIRLDPQLVSAYSNRARVYTNLGQFEKAIQDWTETIRLDPQFSTVYHNRGHVYYDLGQRKQAIEDYGQAIRLNPQHVDAYINRGIVYGKLGQYGRALQDFDKAISLTPQLAAFNDPALAYPFLIQDGDAQHRAELEAIIEEAKRQR